MLPFQFLSFWLAQKWTINFINQIEAATHNLPLNFCLGSAVMEVIADHTPNTSQKTSDMNPSFPEA